MVTTVDKTVGGTSPDYTTWALWEADGPLVLANVEKWPSDNFSGTFVQDEALTWTSSTGTLIDTDNSTYMVIEVLTGSLANNDAISAAGSGASCDIDTPVTDSGGAIWRGLQRDVELSGSVTIDGHTTTATQYMHMDAESGASFVDQAERALFYDSANGAAITNGSDTITFSDDFCRITRLQVQVDTGAHARSSIRVNSVDTFTVDQCIVESDSDSHKSAVGCSSTSTGTQIVSNSVVVNKRTGNSRAVAIGAATAITVLCYNNIAVVPSNFTDTAGTGFGFNGTSLVTVQNCVALGYNTSYEDANIDTASYNARDDGNTDVGTGSIAVTFDDTLIKETDSTTGLDARITDASSALYGAGNTDASYPTDIFDQTRKTGTDGDMGPYDIAAAAAGGPKNPLAGPLSGPLAGPLG